MQAGRSLTNVLLAAVILLTLVGSLPVSGAREINSAIIFSIEPPWDTIDKGVEECVLQALQYAEERGVALILKIDSYGGILDSALTIGDAILDSEIPVIAYVSGGKALSAGTLILIPAHVVAVAPHAIIGAMQPIMYDPVTGSYQFVNETKIINPIVEKVVTYAKVRGRNETAVELFVKQNLVLDADDAVRYGVADFTVEDLGDLLSRLRGMEVDVNGEPVVLEIEVTEEFQCGIRPRVLSILSNPLLASVLLSIGIMATIFALVAGKLPVLPLAILFLVLGLIGSGFSANLASIFMIVLGVVLLSVELFLTPGFGILGITGIIFLVLGFALIPTAAPTTFVPPPGYLERIRAFAVGIGLSLGAFTGFVVYKVIKAKRMKATLFELKGKVGRALEDIRKDSIGFVSVEGEYWRARALEDIEKGSEVEVVGQEDHVLLVRKYAGSGEG